MEARNFLYASFNQAGQWCDVTFYSRFLGRLVRISLHQANFSPFNIVHKIDDRKAYGFFVRLIYTLPGIEIPMG